MPRFPILILPAALALLSSCSSAFTGETQKITVETPGARDSKCILDNGEIVYAAYPPQTITISRRAPVLNVKCQAYGNRERTVQVKAGNPDSYYLNVLNGGVGAVADRFSGAMYRYPEKVVVDFTDEKPRPYPLPDYHLDYLENPAVAGLEEFRSGKPALLRDQYERIPSMKKRETTDEEGQNTAMDLIVGGGGGKPAESSSASSTAAPVPSDSPGPAEGQSLGLSEGESDSLTRSHNPGVFGGGKNAPLPLFPVE